ncbi:MAG: hypothetical protein ACOY3L_08555 [Pseudomonadota bacterium]
MSDIEQLQRRVEAAERRFGMMGEQQGKYSARLIQLMDRIEQRAAERERELDRHIGEMQRLKRDHEQVKTMLHALLAAIEAGGGDALMAALHEMDRKASALVGESPAAEMSAAQAAAMLAPAEKTVAAGEMFQGHFEDVTPETLAAEEAAENEAAAEDRVATDVQAGTGDTEAGGAPSASPVAHIIQRIGQMTRDLADQPQAAAPALAARPQVRHVQVTLHRAAS